MDRRPDGVSRGVRAVIDGGDPRVVAAAGLRVDAAGAEVRSALTARGVDHVLLKGRSLARLLYDRDWERPYADTDLLVAPSDRDTALAVARAAGFVAVDVEVLPEYAVAFARPDGALVDLHWRLWGPRATAEAVWLRLAEHRVPMVVAGLEASALDEVASALIVALHCAHHGNERPSVFEDLRRAATRITPGQWEQARALAADLDAVDALAAGLRLDAEGDALADALGLGRPTTTALWLKTHDADGGASVLARLEATPAGAARGRLALGLLVPPPRLMRRFVPLARRGRLGLALAYLIRPGRLARRVGPAVSDWRRARRAVRAGGRRS